MYLHDTADKVGAGALVSTITLDALIHQGLSALSVVAVLVTIVCQLTQLALRWSEREASRRRFKARCFRQWEAQRDRQ